MKRVPKTDDAVYSKYFGEGVLIDYVDLSNTPLAKWLRERKIPLEGEYVIDWKNDEYEPHYIEVDELTWDDSNKCWLTGTED